MSAALLALTVATIAAGELTVTEPPAGETRTEVYTAMIREGRANEWDCIDQLFRAESGWNPDAVGDQHLGGSHGLPQRHAPAWGAPPEPWPITDQVAWTIEYADGRYGGICPAWEAWLSRATDDGQGGWW